MLNVHLMLGVKYQADNDEQKYKCRKVVLERENVLYFRVVSRTKIPRMGQLGGTWNISRSMYHLNNRLQTKFLVEFTMYGYSKKCL